ncbi:MAG: aminodeoxychorismate synthase component I [Gammaproteobacteria bacterium]|nr:aminodeoxychorismate synthase component I [Gammaproteobacteria bacterium]
MTATANDDRDTSEIVIRSIDSSLDLLRLHELNPGRYPHLLQSVTPGPHARYDILFAFPEDTLSLAADGSLCGGEGGVTDFLSALDARWRREACAQHPPQISPDAHLPFHGGWFLYLGYELAGQIEPRLRLPASPAANPIALATRFRTALIRDHQDHALWLVTEAGTEDHLDSVMRDVAQVEAIPETVSMDIPAAEFTEDDPERYLAMVRRTLAYIRDGDIFQANLARTWTARFAQTVDPSTLYRRLRTRNPGPFNGLATWPGHAVISSSPERLVRVRGGVIDTRPIAGTRPRGQGADADAALSRELLAHPKERAEHIMLIDLERNDLGRVCVPGTVRVDELMVLESYAHVHHIVSNVRGELRDDITPGAVIRALFPGGTITGCPKVRCMEIIAELEGSGPIGRGRGAYTGAMGYLNRNGDLDLNILIRTLEQHGEVVELRAGAGIVADSDPERELAETRAKARGLLLALGAD